MPMLGVLVLFDEFTKSLRNDLAVDTWIKPGLISWYSISLREVLLSQCLD